MKKIFILILTVIVCLSFVACGNSKNVDTAKESLSSEVASAEDESVAEEIEVENKLSLGETASTDLAEFTLHNAEFAFFVDNTINDNEYLPTDDSDSIYAASLGNCLVSLKFTVKNKDRAGSISYCGPFSEWEPGWIVTYDKKTYDVRAFDLNMNEGDYYMELSHSVVINSENDKVIERHRSSNYLIDAGETVTLRTFGIINTEPKKLTDAFDFTIQVPTSKGEYIEFTYAIPERQASDTEDNKNAKSNGMSVESAIDVFTEEDGQTYFKTHMNDYAVMSGTGIEAVVSGNSWNVVMKLSYGTWKGTFAFEADGRIKETIPKIGTGYFNNRTWSINEDTLILDNEDVCQVRKINDSTYLLVKDNEPYAILN